MSATLRDYLNRSGFDWKTGRIIISTGEYEVEKVEQISLDDPILDWPFDDGYGLAECPHYIADDKDAIYFPEQYDGATAPVRVEKDITAYLENVRLRSPYPGG